MEWMLLDLRQFTSVYFHLHRICTGFTWDVNRYKSICQSTSDNFRFKSVLHGFATIYTRYVGCMSDLHQIIQLTATYMMTPARDPTQQGFEITLMARNAGGHLSRTRNGANRTR